MSTNSRLFSRRHIVGASVGVAAGALLAGAKRPVINAQQGELEFHAAWPYLDPGAGGHFNHFVTNSILTPPNIYGDLMFAPLGMQYWANNEWLPLLAESWSFIRTNHEAATPSSSSNDESESDIANSDTLQVVLRQGVMWSDGNPVTSRDVIDTFDILRLQSNTVWDYLSSIEELDDHTLNFYMSSPSTVVERYVIRRSPLPSAIYGEWAQKARDIIASGKQPEDPEWTQLNEEFNAFRPTTLIVNGPYTIDIDSVTNAQFSMPRNPDSYWAANAKFDRIVNFNGETDTISAVVLSKDIDYATQGFPPATEQSMIDAGIRILRPPVYNGPALLINFGKLAHFADKRVRQALAHAIDRDQTAVVSHGQSGIGVRYMTGFSDNLVPTWLADDVASQLNPYEYDQEKAASLLEEAGWTKDGDWWKDPSGQVAEFDLTFPTEYARQSAAGIDIAEQLTAFGFNITPRAITFTQIGPDIEEGRFDFAIQTWGNSSSPHPHYSFVADFFTFNARTDQPGKRGIDFPLQQDTDALGQVDIDQMVVESGEGMDSEAQRKRVAELAQVFNELLPKLPICESLGNNAALEGVRVQSWPADDDPLLKNSPYADGIPTMLIYTGDLVPVDQ